MKKNRVYALVAAVLLLVQLAVPGVQAAELTSVPETTEAATTAPPAPQVSTFTGADESVQSGCRTIDAQVPLYGEKALLQTARCALLYEVNTGTMLYFYNPDLQFSPSSIVKIMTVLLAIENGNLNDKVTVTKEVLDTVDRSSVTVGLKEGEVLTLEQLLYGAMVGSGNDACAVIAQHIAGNQDRFVAMMNKRAEQLGCTNTVFTNVHGLEHSKQLSTARDIARIVMEAMKSETFMTIFKKPIYDMPATEKNEEVRWYSNNYMLSEFIISKFYDTRVTGGRAGTTGDDGQNLVITAESGEFKYVAVVLGAERTLEKRSSGTIIRRYGNFEEMQELLTMGFENTKICQLLYQGQITDQYQVMNGECAVAATPEITVRTVLPTKVKAEGLTWRTQTYETALQAPVAQGDLISLVQVWYGNVCIAQTQMKAANNVDVLVVQDNNGNGLFDSDGFVTALIVLGGIFIIILAFFGVMYIIRSIRGAMRRSRSRKRRRSRRRSR